MSTITELNPRLLPVPGAADLGRIFFLTEFAVAVAGWVLETPRAHGLPAERVDAQGDPAAAVRALTERITAILQES